MSRYIIYFIKSYNYYLIIFNIVLVKLNLKTYKKTVDKMDNYELRVPINKEVSLRMRFEKEKEAKTIYDAIMNPTVMSKRDMAEKAGVGKEDGDVF